MRCSCPCHTDAGLPAHFSPGTCCCPHGYVYNCPEVPDAAE